MWRDQRFSECILKGQLTFSDLSDVENEKGVKDDWVWIMESGGAVD